MKRLIPFGVLFFICTSCFSQRQGQALIDSLLTELSKAKEDTNKVKLYCNIITLHVDISSYTGLKYEKPATELARKLKWDLGIADVKENIGRIYWRKGNFEQALKYHGDALKIYKEKGIKKRIGNCITTIGQDYADAGNYPEALNHFGKARAIWEETGDKTSLANNYLLFAFVYNCMGNFAASSKSNYEALKIYESIGDKYGASIALTNMADDFLNLGNLSKALEYYQEGLTVIRQTGDPVNECTCYSMMGSINKRMYNYRMAISCNLIALKIGRKINNPYCIGSAYRGLGDIYYVQGKLAEALQNYLAAAQMYRKVANKQELASQVTDIGSLYTQMKKYSEAKKYFDEALLLSRELNSKVALADYYHGIEIFDSVTGDWKNAYFNHKSYTRNRDSIYSQERIKKNIQVTMQYEFDKKEVSAKAEQEKKDIRQRFILTSIGAGLAGTLVFLLVVYRQRNSILKAKKRSEELLIEKELLLKEIHHRVKNNLEVISSLLELQTERITDENAKAAIIEGQSRVQSIALIHHKLYRTENVESVEFKNFVSDLYKQVESAFKKSTTEIEFKIIADETTLSINEAVPLGLILNELFTNTFKYGVCDNVKNRITIQLNAQKSEGIYLLIFRDNGPGLPDGYDLQKSTSLGMKVIQLLTKQLGGKLNYYNDNGSVFEIPFIINNR